MPIEWKQEYETGLAEVDADHRDLVGLVNLLESALDDRAVDPGPILLALRGYVHSHFRREEAIFLHDAHYPPADRAAHLAQHEAFRSEVQKVDARFRSDPGALDLVDLHAFLRDWLVNHILRTDKDFAAKCRGAA